MQCCSNIDIELHGYFVRMFCSYSIACSLCRLLTMCFFLVWSLRVTKSTFRKKGEGGEWGEVREWVTQRLIDKNCITKEKNRVSELWIDMHKYGYFKIYRIMLFSFWLVWPTTTLAWTPLTSIKKLHGIKSLNFFLISSSESLPLLLL